MLHPTIEQLGPGRRYILGVAGCQTQQVFNRGRGQHRVDDGRRMAGVTPYPARQCAPAADHVIGNRQDATRKARLQGVAPM